MANNDPNYFLTNFKGDFNGNSTDNSGYGMLPAAEQNQTYFAYFDAISSTTPEIINQTSFFIKYLIDKDGNISKPKSDNISLINLYNNFDQKKVTVVSPQIATQTAANLIGNQFITDIGTIQPLIITEFGSNPLNYIKTASFNQYPALPPLDTDPPNYAFLAKKSTTTTTTPDNSTTVAFQTEINDNLQAFSTATSFYTFPNNTIDYNIYVSFQVGIAAKNVDSNNAHAANPLLIYIQVSTDNGSTWNNLPIRESVPPTTNTNTNLGIISPNGYYYIDTMQTEGTVYNYIESLPQVFNSGDKVRVQIWTYGDTLIYGLNNTSETYFKLTTNYDSSTKITSSYWDGITYPVNNSSQNYHTPQYLTASLQFSSVLNNNYIQSTPDLALSMSFNSIMLPANIQSGDYIRFEYDPTKQSRIYGVGNLDDGRVTLKIFPAILPGTQLNHFVIYRVVKDGNCIIINQPKFSNANLNGFILPAYISQELKDNFTNIISKLEADGLLT